MQEIQQQEEGLLEGDAPSAQALGGAPSAQAPHVCKSTCCIAHTKKIKRKMG